MSQLVQLRQRISTIETIKKITHAMRLIAMSTHSRLRNKQEPLAHYQKTIRTIYARVKASLPPANKVMLTTTNNQELPELIIVIGSQKGLCGTFNNSLFSAFEKEIKTKDAASVLYIAVGKKAVDYLTLKRKFSCIATFDHFTIKTLPTIAQKIISLIISENSFSKVSVISNKFKTFFLQIPEVTPLLPVDDSFLKETPAQEKIEYVWEQNAEVIVQTLAQFYLTSSLEDLLFQSLLAEQAARFISMDSATRNAEQLLEKSTLDYNKLRQAKITKELTEITGSI